MTNETNLYDISAEFLLNYLYPDRMDQWEVDCAGTFYRNYSEDILAIDEEKGAGRTPGTRQLPAIAATGRDRQRQRLERKQL